MSVEQTPLGNDAYIFRHVKYPPNTTCLISSHGSQFPSNEVFFVRPKTAIKFYIPDGYNGVTARTGSKAHDDIVDDSVEAIYYEEVGLRRKPIGWCETKRTGQTCIDYKLSKKRNVSSRWVFRKAQGFMTYPSIISFMNKARHDNVDIVTIRHYQTVALSALVRRLSDRGYTEIRTCFCRSPYLAWNKAKGNASPVTKALIGQWDDGDLV